jgi:hypothetical protein
MLFDYILLLVWGIAIFWLCFRFLELLEHLDALEPSGGILWTPELSMQTAHEQI